MLRGFFVTCVKLIFKFCTNCTNVLHIIRFKMNFSDQIIPLANGIPRITVDFENCVCITYEHTVSHVNFLSRLHRT